MGENALVAVAILHTGWIDDAGKDGYLGLVSRSAAVDGAFAFSGARNLDHSKEKTVVIHTAGSATEAMVIRGLLQSAGIESPGSATTDPFPMAESGDAFHGSDVIVLESQADQARRVIADYLQSNEGIEVENSEEPDEEGSAS